MNDTLKKAEKIVMWYHNLPPDYIGINEIIHKRKNLSTLYFYLNSQLGVLIR